MKKSICIAANEFEGLDFNGGMGTYFRELSILLSKNGWEVTVLYQSFLHDSVINFSEDTKFKEFAHSFFNKYNITIYNARNLCGKKEKGNETLENINNIRTSDPDNAGISQYHLACSHIFHEALQTLIDSGIKFSLIEFPDFCGPGIIPIRMKKNFNKYSESKIIVKLHGPTMWIKDSSLSAGLSANDLFINFLEEYSFENADIQVSPSQHLLEWCKNNNWNVRNDAEICRYPINSLIGVTYPEGITERNNLIFFGRIEVRKGIKEFINALKFIHKSNPNFSDNYNILFVGKENDISIDYIKTQLCDFKLNFIVLPRDDALFFLKKHARMVIIPSLQDNYPNTVLECMSYGIPFITSRNGGIPEMLGYNSQLYHSISCDVHNPEQFGNAILQYLDYCEDNVKNLINLAFIRIKEITNSATILEWYDNKIKHLEDNFSYPKIKRDFLTPGITVLIPTLNETTEIYLESTLQSLLLQSYKNIKIIINDASTTSKALSKYNQLKEKHQTNKNLIFLHQNHQGIGNALNQILQLVDTKYVMEVDGDNIAKPNMIETFVQCMENQQYITGLSCYHQSFYDENEEKIMNSIMNNDIGPNLTCSRIYTPIGPCLPLVFFHNVMGDANSIYLTDALKKVGGWPEERTGFHDWALFLKLLANGYKLDVIPQFLYYYRVNLNSDGKTKNLFYIDKNNIKYVELLIKNNPEHFSYLYKILHRLIRNEYIIRKGRNTNLIENKNALYFLGVKLGEISSRSQVAETFFNFSGKYLKKILNTK